MTSNNVYVTSRDSSRSDGAVHSGRDEKGPVPLRKPKKSAGRESCEKYFVSK